jgi:hypothetical protein
LLQLDLTGNPVQQNKAYRLHVQSELQQLEQLDRQAVTSCSPAAAVLTPDLLRAGATQWHSQKGVHGKPGPRNQWRQAHLLRAFCFALA